jgi:hypothetical protein
MSVLRILIDTDKTAATMKNLLRAATSDRDMLIALSEYFAAIAGGGENAKVRLNVGGTVGLATVTFASFADTDTVTVNGVVLTGKTSPSGLVQFAVGASNAACSNNFVACVNACTTAKIVGEVYATRRATIACASVVNTNTLIVNGITFTVKTTPTAGTYTDMAVGASNTLMGDIVAKAINEAAEYEPALKGLITAVNAAGTVTINYDGSLVITSTGGTMTVANDICVISSLYGGTIVNLNTLAISAHGTVSGAVFTTGANGTFYNYI